MILWNTHFLPSPRRQVIYQLLAELYGSISTGGKAQRPFQSPTVQAVLFPSEKPGFQEEVLVFLFVFVLCVCFQG